MVKKKNNKKKQKQKQKNLYIAVHLALEYSSNLVTLK